MAILVVQGEAIAPADLQALVRVSAPSRVEPIDAHAVRLHGARRDPQVATLCAAAELDHAYVPEDRRLADFGLAVTDMDSTLIRIECIDEIADLQGLKAEVGAITAAAMRGELDYAQSLKERVRLLAGLDVEALERVYSERLQLTEGAERLLQTFRARGIRTLLVSGGFSFYTERLKARLPIDYTCANELEVRNGRLTGRLLGDVVDAEGKAHALERVRAELGLGRDQVIGMGDGANDLPFLAAAGVSVAFRAKPVVRDAATHCLDHVGLDGVLNLFADA
jgi:phosphoserine phosphatase